MLEFPRWKYVLILMVLAVAILYSLPNIYPQDPSVQINANRNGQIDDALRQRIEASLNMAGIAPKAVETTESGMLVRLPNLDLQTKAADLLRPELGEDYVVALNLASTVPEWLSRIGAKPMVLGLDLQGGVHFVLQIDQKSALDKRVETYLEDTRVTLRDNRIRFDSVERRPDNSIVVTLVDAADSTKARDQLAKTLMASGASNTAALVGAAQLTYQINGNIITIGLPQSELGKIGSEAIEQNIATLRRRVNELGVAEPLIQRQGDDRIVVQLPGVQDTAAAKRMIGATATLEYRAVVEGDAADAARTGRVPPGAKLYYDRMGAPVLLNRRVIVTGDQMVAAQPTVDERGGAAVSVTLNNSGGQRMFDFTGANVGKPMAVVYTERIPQVTEVDGKEVRSFRIKEEVISIATIQGVFGKTFQTTGLGKTESEDLAKLLRAGSLAAPMDFVEERVVGPSLGAENVERGVTAVLYAFLFTLLFFTIYYRMFGIVTSVALLMNLLIVVAVMSLFGATMTLPGFAGLALSIGLSVDANVLINERIREELRAGTPPKSAIVAGYEKASGTILDANLTGILAGIALYAFGTGPLKGFAVTMVVGIIASMFTAITVSRAIAVLLYRPRKKLKTLAI
ncbi:MAG: protein translocase subunit SecD [Xanthomonadaceae bacterium]|jgi:preprotein translocase subunit SecD|nr:protein translocase subunit SecD [Xanthomonadaceae bacterium]